MARRFRGCTFQTWIWVTNQTGATVMSKTSTGMIDARDTG